MTYDLLYLPDPHTMTIMRLHIQQASTQKPESENNLTSQNLTPTYLHYFVVFCTKVTPVAQINCRPFLHLKVL